MSATPPDPETKLPRGPGTPSLGPSPTRIASAELRHEAQRAMIWIALVSPLGPLICVATTEMLERKWVLVALASSMAVSGLAFPFAQTGLQIVLAGAALTLFSLEKAAYEIVYESGHRPDWIDVPLQGLVDLARQLMEITS